mmetsp:Transcript_21870/g.72452  ORF Transcript_21870/g.72452 Transcript_21870/m.72452 type:complete len:492 (-) Transcript_21870:415-1890(-)
MQAVPAPRCREKMLEPRAARHKPPQPLKTNALSSGPFAHQSLSTTASLHVELDAQQVLLADLRHVVDDKLVVQQRGARHGCLLGLPLWNEHGRVGRQRHCAGGVRPSRSLAECGVLSSLLRRRARAVLGLETLVLVAERHVAQQQHARRRLARGEAVVCALGDHVCEVDALAKHVARDGRLGWCDAQPLREDARPVGQARAVPQQLPVGERRLEARLLGRARDGEHVLDVDLVRVVRRAVRVGRVPPDHLVLRLRRRREPALELRVHSVERVLLGGRAEALRELLRLLHLQQRLDHVELVLEHRQRVDDGRHLVEAELVRDRGVEVRRQREQPVLLLVAVCRRRLQLRRDARERLVAALDLRRRDRAERHLFEVDVHLLQLRSHHLLVADQRHEPRYRRRQRRAHRGAAGRLAAAARRRLARRLVGELARQQRDRVPARVLHRRLAPLKVALGELLELFAKLLLGAVEVDAVLVDDVRVEVARHRLALASA